MSHNIVQGTMSKSLENMSFLSGLFAGVFLCVFSILFMLVMSLRSVRPKTTKQVPKLQSHFYKESWLEFSDTPNDNGLKKLPPKGLLSATLKALFSSQSQEEEPSHRRMLYAILKHSSLFLYENESQSVCVDVLLLAQYHIELYPSHVPNYERFLKDHPICLIPKKSTDGILYIYATSGSEKEDWFILLKRACLKTFNSQHEQAMTSYIESMTKLVQTVKQSDSDDQSTAWLNALLGRAFVAVNSNPKIQHFFIQKLNRHMNLETSPSILSEIVIQEVSFGNSLPVFKNPKLVDISVDGDMQVEMGN
jgi:hypothetical protein